MLPMASVTKGPAVVSLVLRMDLYRVAVPSMSSGTKTMLLRVSCQEALIASTKPVPMVIRSVIIAAIASPVKDLIKGASDARRSARWPLVRTSNQATSCRSMALNVSSLTCLVKDSAALRNRPSCPKERTPVPTARTTNLRHSMLVLFFRSGSMLPTHFPWKASYLAGGWLKRFPTPAKSQPMNGRAAATGTVHIIAKATTGQSGFCNAQSLVVGTGISTLSSGGESGGAWAGSPALTERSRPPALTWRKSSCERVEVERSRFSPERLISESPVACCSSTSWA
mmetsp:Transcript_70584/g.206590  ORF Transcript_70584/g.206590 Transcript_70584/m.206590 type:complete len:283 (-) Transcript_70584:1059-1907(-)